MKLYEITGCRDSEFNGMVFGHFTSRELAEKAYGLMPPEIAEETVVVQSNLDVNTIEVGGEIIDVSEK